MTLLNLPVRRESREPFLEYPAAAAILTAPSAAFFFALSMEPGPPCARTLRGPFCWRLSRLLSLSDLVCHKTQTSDADAGGRMDASASGRWYPKALDPPRSDEECIDYYRILCSNSVKKFARCSDFTCPTISRTGHVVLPVPRHTLTSDLACAWTRWCKHFHPGI